MMIDNWEVEELGEGRRWVTGNIYGNRFHQDGKFIHTSLVTDLDLEKREVRTLNSTYSLGTPRGGNAGAA